MRSAVRTRVIAGASALVLAAGLGACSGEDAEPKDAKPTVLTADASTPFAQEGKDWRVVGSLLGRLGDRSAGFGGWAEDGTEIYTRAPGRFDLAERRGASDPRLAALMARDPKTGRTRVLSDRPRTAPPPASPFARDLGYSAVTTAGNRVLWVEGNDVSLGDLWVHDLGSGRETRLVSAKEAGRADAPWPTGMVDPVVYDDTVYFVGYTEATVSELRGAQGRTSVFSVPIDGSGKPTEVVPGATDVFPAPDGLLDAVFVNRMVRWDPAKGRDGELKDTKVSGAELFANEAGVRMSHVEDGEPLVIDSPQHGRFEITVGDGSSEYLSATERWASFSFDVGDGTQAFLLDMARGELRRVKGAQVAWNPRPRTSETYIPRINRQIAPKTYDVVELLPAG